MVRKLDYCCSVLGDVSATQLHRLQSILTAAARLVYSAKKSSRACDGVMPLLRDLHLKIPERIQFRICVLVKTLCCAPSYLAETLHLLSDMEPRRRLRSASLSTLRIPSKRSSTLGERAFPIAEANAWNSLPSSIRTIDGNLTFQRHLKRELFSQCSYLRD